MREQRNPVDWKLWLDSRGSDVRRPDRMFSTPDPQGSVFCQLCEQKVPAWKRAEHHRAHMGELDGWLAEQEAPKGPKPDSKRRDRDRRARRELALARAVAFGEDPYFYAVDKVEPVSKKPGDKRVRPIKTRRLRHTREETLQHVKMLRDEGLMLAAIADRLQISENYTRRMLRQLEEVEKDGR